VTPRNLTIDIAKGIGIIFVVLGHNWLTEHHKGELWRVLYSFHMPLFFFLAGVVMKVPQNFYAMLRARAHALLKPFFVILLLLGVVKLAIAVAQGTFEPRFFGYFWGVAYATGNTLVWTPMWFLPHLFLASVACHLVLRATTRLTHAWLWVTLSGVALFALGAANLGMFWHPEPVDWRFMGIAGLPGLPWSADLLPVTMAFMLVGCVLAPQVKRLRWNPWAGGAATLLFALLHIVFNDSIDLNLRVMGYPLVVVPQAALGIYGVLQLSALLASWSAAAGPLAYLGRGSLFILIFHDTLQRKLIAFLASLSESMVANSVLALVISLAVPLLVWAIAQRVKLLSFLLLPPPPARQAI